MSKQYLQQIPNNKKALKIEQIFLLGKIISFSFFNLCSKIIILTSFSNLSDLSEVTKNSILTCITNCNLLQHFFREVLLFNTVSNFNNSTTIFEKFKTKSNRL